MQVPLTDIEYTILDYLADGAQPLAWLVRELHVGKQHLDTSAIINSLTKLVERQLIHYSETPGGPHYTSPLPEHIHAQVMSVLNNGEQPWWLELTDHGQETWEAWQQSHPDL